MAFGREEGEKVDQNGWAVVPPGDKTGSVPEVFVYPVKTFGLEYLWYCVNSNVFFG